MTIRSLILALAVAWVAALVGLVWMMALGGMRPHHALPAFIPMDPFLSVCVVLSVGSAAIGIVSAHAGARRRARTGVGGAFGCGVAGALYGAAGARSMLINMNPPIPFSVYAPNYAEAFIVLLIGLTGALLVLVRLRRRGPG